MAITEKISQTDLILYEIIKNPILCAEFINNYDKLPEEEPFELTYYQKEMMGDFNPHSSLCCARSVGKTVSLSNLLIWMLIFNVFPSDYIVYTVPSKVHLEPVFLNLIRMFRGNTFLKFFIAPRTGINSSDHTITLDNQAVLKCRIAGQSGTGANVIGLHTPVVFLDEAGYYPWGTWVELQPIVNTWTPGFRVIASGVPTGLRENNVLYHTDMENGNYTKHRISAYENPRFTKKDEEEAIIKYGGKDSDDFIHLVLGEHGKPLFALFDRAALAIQDYPVYKLKLDGIRLQKDLNEYIKKLALFPGIPNNRPVIMGIDLGYTEPTAIQILYQAPGGQWKFHGRIQLTKVSYPIQERLIDYLDTRFKPILIGIDKGSSGISVIQHLIDEPSYAHKKYEKIVSQIDFSGQIILGIDADGEEIKEKTKPFSVSVLQDYSNTHKIVYSSTDPEMIVELERMTYTKTPTGNIIYKTLTPSGGERGEDHFTSALLCATMAHFLSTDYIQSRKRTKLAGVSWLPT